MGGGWLVLAVVLAGPWSGQPGPGPVARPAWIAVLPEAPGRIYALGTADLGASEGQALTRAGDRARLEVVARLRTTVRGQTSVATRTGELRREGAGPAGAGERQVRDEVTVTTQAEQLPGLVVEQTYADPGSNTLYALAYLDLAQARATLATRLEFVRDARLRVGAEASRRAQWRLRKLQEDLDRLEETLGLLAFAAPRADPRTAKPKDPRPDPRTDNRPDPRTDSRPDQRTDSRPDPRTGSRPDPRTDSRPDSRTDSRPDSSTDTRADPRADTPRDPPPDPDLRQALLDERAALDQRLAALAKADLPAPDWSSTTVGLRSNVPLPPGLQAYLEAQLLACGFAHRTLQPDLVLDLAFAGGAQGADIVTVAFDAAGGKSFRLDAQLRLLDAGGLPVTRPVPIQIIQTHTPEGMINQFRRLFERRLPRLLAAYRADLQ